MAKNYQQAGLTIPVTNNANTVLKSGSPVVLGDLITIIIADIAAGETGEHKGPFACPS